MRYRIDQDQLWEFLARQAHLVERLPVEAAEAAADGYSDGLDESEREAVWLAAGIATFIGELTDTDRENTRRLYELTFQVVEQLGRSAAGRRA